MNGVWLVNILFILYVYTVPVLSVSVDAFVTTIVSKVLLRDESPLIHPPKL